MTNDSQLASSFDSLSFIASDLAFLKQIYSCRADATYGGNEEISFHESIRGVKRSPRRGRRLSNVANAVSIIPSNVAAWICAPNEKHQDFVMHYSIRRYTTSCVLDQTWILIKFEKQSDVFIENNSVLSL